MRQIGDGPERQARAGAGLDQKPRDGFRHHAAFLRQGAPLRQHGHVELSCRQPLQRILADATEARFVHAAQDAIFEVFVA